MVLSLYCSPCAREWGTLNQWLATDPDSLWLTVRFTGYQQNGELKELIDRLAGIFMEQGQDSFREALTGWFEIRETQKWEAKFPVQTVQHSFLSKTARWEQSLPITYTPTVFVDDRILPSMYHVKDLEYLLKE
jgi:hypothetical protein